MSRYHRLRGLKESKVSGETEVVINIEEERECFRQLDVPRDQLFI